MLAVVVSGRTFQAEDGALIYDRGAGSAVFDCGDVIRGQGTMYWNGAVRAGLWGIAQGRAMRWDETSLLDLSNSMRTDRAK